MFYDISKKSKYAVLALVELAMSGPTRPLNARRLAVRNALPVRFLEIIMNELKQGNFVTSIRGKSGGYVLSRPAGQITFGQLLRFFETRPSNAEKMQELPLPGQCVIDSLMQQTNTIIAELFDKCTLEEMVQRNIQFQTAAGTNYVI